MSARADHGRGGRLRGILFDLDGVLVDSEAAWRALLADAVLAFDGRAFTEAEWRDAWGQSVEEDCRRFVPGVTPARLNAFYRERFAGRALLVRPLPGAREALAACSARGLPRAVVTNSPAAVARAVLDATGLLPLVDALVGADEVPRPKPDPDLVLAGAARLGLAPADVALVGDSRFDVAAARAAGARAVAVVPGLGADLELASLHDLASHL